MAGLTDADIKLDEDWRLTQAANGDAPVANGFDCVMQDIRLEAMTQEGDLFYDLKWGWSLLDFLHGEDDALTVIEVERRVRMKLENRGIIDAGTISVKAVFSGDILNVYASFRFLVDNAERSIRVTADRVGVEVSAE